MYACRGNYSKQNERRNQGSRCITGRPVSYWEDHLHNRAEHIYTYLTIPCLDGHPQKFIRKKLKDDQTLKILYLEENFPIYDRLLYISMISL